MLLGFGEKIARNHLGQNYRILHLMEVVLLPLDLKNMHICLAGTEEFLQIRCGDMLQKVILGSVYQMVLSQQEANQ